MSITVSPVRWSQLPPVLHCDIIQTKLICDPALKFGSVNDGYVAQLPIHHIIIGLHHNFVSPILEWALSRGAIAWQISFEAYAFLFCGLAHGLPGYAFLSNLVVGIRL